MYHAALAGTVPLSYSLRVRVSLYVVDTSRLLRAAAFLTAAVVLTAQDAPHVQPDAAGTIAGTVSNSDGLAAAGALVRLRHAVDGQAMAETRTDQRGRFEIARVPASPWLMEVVSERPRVIAVSDVLTVENGKNVTANLRVNARAPWTADFFRNSASAAITAAAAQGITAIGSNERPVSPR